MIARTLVVAACVFAATACGEPATLTVVFVTVDARPGVTSVDKIDVTVHNESASVSQTFDLDGRDFPVTFTVTPSERVGSIRVEVTGMDGEGNLRGEGSASSTIVTDEQIDVDVLLDPSDFPINDDIAGTQRLTFEYEASGRQLAADADGFFVAFVNDCAMLSRCDVLSRRFDAAGTPLVNDTSMDDGDFIANLTDEFTAAPAVAIGSASVLIAWETNDAIKAVALSARGEHLQFTETQVSTSLLLVADPTVAALPSGEFIVAWSEDQDDGSTAIHGRFLDSDGVPQTNPTTGDSLDFAVSWPEAGEAERVHIAPSGVGRGFVAVWKRSEGFLEPSNVRARFFTSNGAAAAVGNAQITSFTDGEVYGPHALYLGPNEAMVAYSAETVEDSRLANGAIVLSRFSSPAGNQVGANVIIPAELPFDAVVPAVAQRADGTIGVSWHQCDANGDGMGCGILVQAARSSGMPVGEPAIVNTTRAGDQETPSIAALGETFVLAWTDASMAEPDISELGVRGRLIYLEADVRDGRLGANCGSLGDAKCGAELVCVPGNEGSPLCHAACTPGDLVPCPGGGVCNTVGEDSACLF